MARIAMGLAFDHPVGGVTVNRFCASGITALQMAADRIRVGEADVLIAGGAESMSLVPMGGNKPSFNAEIFAKDENVGIAYGMGLTAEKVAQQWKVSREMQDAFALESHLRAIKAQKAGEFTDEITPIEIVERSPNLATGEVVEKRRTVSLDEGPRPDTSPGRPGQAQARVCRTRQRHGGQQLADQRWRRCPHRGQRKGGEAVWPDALARFCELRRAWRAAEIMGIGPIEAIPAALRYAGLKSDDIGWYELNEAFAAQSLAVINTLGLNPANVNPMGGAIALGHPLGATGAIRAATVVHALRRHKLKYGMVTMCVGTGQAPPRHHRSSLS